MLLAVLFAHHAVRALRREIEGDDMRQRELAAATITALTLAPLLVLAHHDGIYFVLLTIAGSKLATYLLPAFPAVALLAARAIVSAPAAYAASA